MSPARRDLSTSINQYGCFPVTVTRTQQLSQHFVRVSLTGPALHHAANDISDGTGQVYDAYIKLIVPPAGSTTAVTIELDDTWRQRWFSQPETRRGAIRTYTVQNSRLILTPQPPTADRLGGLIPAASADLSPLHRDLPAGLQPEIDIDFVLHTDSDGQMGPGSTWAATAQPGNVVSLLAPLRQAPLWSSWNSSAHHQRIIVLVDETAVPAAVSILRSLPADTTGSVYLEIPGPEDDLSHLPDIAEARTRLPNLTITFLPRNHAQRGAALDTALRTRFNLTPNPSYTYHPDTDSDEIVWGLADEDTSTYVFIAGESSVIKTLRRTCVNDANIPKTNISFMGYWKDGRAEN